jgi:pimeloyl-ACP methyl ester carboxylesterase
MPAVAEERDIRTPDGRTLRIRIDGADDGPAILVHHGTPGCRLLYGMHVEDARKRGARLIGYDRAGYAGSSPLPGRRVADIAADVEAIADALELERLATWGISGGGPHALACAALLPDRIFAAASLAGVAPYDAEGLDFLAGMGESNVEEFEAATKGRDVLEPFLVNLRAEMLAEGPETMSAAIESLLSPPDAAVFTGEVGQFMYDSTAAALEPGVEGWVEDDIEWVEPWGFDLASIRVPVVIWQGEQDRFVPPAHGRWLAAHVPGCEAHLSPDDGHVTLKETRVPEVHAWLLERAG